MFKKVFVLFVIIISFFINTSFVFADEKDPGYACDPNVDTCKAIIDGKTGKPVHYSCQPEPADPKQSTCQQAGVIDAFGKIKPPDALLPFVQKDPTGAGGISLFLSNLVALIFSLAAVVLIFMILWGAFDWMTSEGDKEKLERARNKIINAIIGILLFAAAFAIIRIIGQFTGFKFFLGQ